MVGIEVVLDVFGNIPFDFVLLYGFARCINCLCNHVLVHVSHTNLLLIESCSHQPGKLYLFKL